MSGGVGYLARHLEHNDYYIENERVTGQWHGTGAAMLGLEGEVTQEDFEAVRQGLDPDSGEFLRQRHGADRTAADGTTQSKARNLYDMTISAPKSVSIMAVVGGDDRLVEAHDKAVAEALHEIESYAAARVRLDGANEDRTTGNMVVAAYRHDSSRELDPQLHTHAVAVNLTFDGAEGRWKALQASDIYSRREYLTEIYRNVLAREVRNLGYEIENRRDQRGRDRGFEIRGVSQELIETFSQRSHQRDQAIAEFTRENGRRPTDNEVAVLVRETRPDKLQEISTTEVRERQQARLSPEQTRSLVEGKAQALEVAHDGKQVDLKPAAESFEYARDHIFERVSVAHDYDLMTGALRHGRGQIDHGDLRGTMQIEEASGRLLRSGPEVATSDSLAREQRMIQSIDRGVGVHERLGGATEFSASPRLRAEQKEAVQFVLDSRDLAVNIQGAAGTGKTAMLQDLHRGIQEGGREVQAIAPTMSAVEELQKVGFRDAVTIERLLQDQRIQENLRGKVLIVDEAGMVSGRQMSELIQVAEQRSARIVFSGDTKQIQSVEASDALRVLEKESKLSSVSLTQVQRQRVDAYRQAIEELRSDPAEGFRGLERMGAIREVSHHERAEAVALACAEARTPRDGSTRERDVLVVCATHDEIGRVTEAIREQRRSAGELGRSAIVTRHVPLNWTEAQKRNPTNYDKGLVLEFHRGVKGIGKNETAEVVRVEDRHLTVRTESGQEREIGAKQAKAFSVHERRPMEIAENDRLLLMANRREAGFRAVNGELVTVRGIGEDGRIQLQDGRTLPANYHQFSHGYAITAHRSQGKTVDAVVISADQMKKELFYVAASRGREQLTVVTSDKELLRDSIARSGARKSAVELVREGHREERPMHYGVRELYREPSQHCERNPANEHERSQEPANELKLQPKSNLHSNDMGHSI